MTPAKLLLILRGKGYVVSVTDGVVSAVGPTPPDPARAAAMLLEHTAGLVALLRVEGWQCARDAMDVLGAVLVSAT